MNRKEFFDWLRSKQDDGILTQQEVDTANDLLEVKSETELRDWLIRVNDWEENAAKQWQMSLSQKGLNAIKQFEGFRSAPYRDAVGVWTIGYGNTYYPDGRKVKSSDKPLTEAQASQLKLDIINRDFASVINLLFIDEIKQGKINQNMFDAMVSLAYNIGAKAFANSSVAKNIKRGNFKAAADSFLLWTKAGGRELKGLVNRRNSERDMFLA